MKLSKIHLVIRNMFIHQSKVGFLGKVRLANGKARRLLLGTMGKPFLSRAKELRYGDCKRCGVCCKLLFECPHLTFDENGLAACEIHDDKPVPCIIFPATPADIRDRDLVAPGTTCGYNFDVEAFNQNCNMPTWRAVFAERRNSKKKKN